MRAWVRDKKPKTCQEAGELTDEYVQTRQVVGAVGGSDRKPPVVHQKRCYSCDRIGHLAKDCSANKSENRKEEAKSIVRMDGSKELKNKSAADSKAESTELNHVKCYNCGEKGHVTTTCPAKVTKPNM